MYLAANLTVGEGAKIGSWEVGKGKLAGSWEGKETGIGTLSIGDKTYAIWSGSNLTSTSALAQITFGVTVEGEMFSTRGNMGGWEISENALKSKDSNVGIWSGLYSGTNTTVNSSGWEFTFGDKVEENDVEGIPATCTLLRAIPIDSNASSIIIFPERIKDNKGKWYTVTKIGGNEIWDKNSIFYHETEGGKGEYYGPVVLKYQIPGSVKIVSSFSLY
jgi:hypothetical protein